MPWRECNLMDERVKSIAQFLGSEKVARLACEFGISSKKAYKIIEGYHDIGLAAGDFNPAMFCSFLGGMACNRHHDELCNRKSFNYTAPAP